jgi:hypothetical protein
MMLTVYNLLGWREGSISFIARHLDEQNALKVERGGRSFDAHQ